MYEVTRTYKVYSIDELPEKMKDKARALFRDDIIILVSDHYGQYMLQELVSRYTIKGVEEEALSIAADGPDNPHYLEVWDEIVDNGYIEVDGRRFNLWVGESDICAVREGSNFEKYFGM